MEPSAVPRKPALIRTTLADQLARQLAMEILRGSIPPGRDLPPLRALARQYGITLPTAQRALAHLEGLGLVEARHGSGLRVLDPTSAVALSALPMWVEASLLDPPHATRLLGDFLELRRLLVAPLLRRARSRLTEADLGRLDQGVSAMESEARRRPADFVRIAEADLALGKILVHRANQAAFATVFNTFGRLLLTLSVLREAVYSDPMRNVFGYRAALALLRSRAGDESLIRIAEESLLETDRVTLRRFSESLRHREN